eukprot:CAMPEP_0198303028 /NCGR_PEP_ID=MMETSP1449-20131203/56675_1 /TAXON_ID=420275 /ORGANISM="Attheya septentrionalis, Strain CCMP2084" /LENGTH=161 /DNA_ID=CAMNT_0044005509 /DNA_START=549 /DNA_END=1034 /DNA_ORIENTATION=+
MRSAIAVILSLAIASTNAFAPAPTFRSSVSMMHPTEIHLMTVEEVDVIMKKATNCEKGECSLDEVENLIKELQSQQKMVYDRVDQITKLIDSLEHVNGQDAREVDEVRETVRAIFRVFQLGDKASGNDYPSLSKPMGYSGDVGDGPTTAYDALPPKPYKKA